MATKFRGNWERRKEEEASPGYASNGESLYTRGAAHPRSRVKLTPRVSVRVAQGRMLSDAELIHEYESRLEWLRCEVAIETSASRVAKLKQQIEIKSRLLAGLKGA
jgi:hypothetical protein